MKITLAKTAGFCMGVRRAVEMVLDAPAKHKNPIYTYGPLIHNPQVLNLLKDKGIRILEHIPDHGSGTVLIRAHGVPPDAKERLKATGFDVIDATCPRVIKVQNIISVHAKEGYASIIIGDRDHPEVIGLLGFAGEKGYVADNLEALDTLPAFEKAIIVVQTTQNVQLFKEVVDWMNRRHPHYKVFNTICDSTERRQAEVRQITDTVDALIVVGGHNSGNTQRLAEIAKHSGKSAYHIETESELDLNTLSSAQHIGITAGASTPNWTIKRVFRTLEALPLKRTEGWSRLLFKIQRTLLLANIYVALGAGCLCYACTKLQGIESYFPHVFISILYVQSMHILNHLTGIKADHYNDPDRAAFYRDHMILLTFMALSAGGTGLMIAYTMGWIPFSVLLVMSLMGLSYNLRLVPERVSGFKYRRIRDIPGSKTLLIAMAWGIVTSILPALATSGSITLKTSIVLIWSVCMVFARTAFFDILDMQGDRIAGKETIPILMGEESALRLLKLVLGVAMLLLLSAGVLGLFTGLGFVLIICPVFIFLILYFHEKGNMLPGIRLEFLVETQFVLSGIIAFIWSGADGF